MFRASYLTLFLVLVATGAGLPVPEEVPVLAAGVMSAQGTLEPWLALATCLLGALVGDSIMYFIGYHFGRGILRRSRWWRHVVPPEREERMEELIRRHGMKVFLVARFLVGLRSPVYLSSGILHIPYRRFLLFDLLSASVVVSTFFGLSYAFGPIVIRWIRGAELLATVSVVVCLAVVAVYLWRRRSRTGKAPQDPGDPEEQDEAPAEKASQGPGDREEQDEAPAEADKKVPARRLPLMSGFPVGDPGVVSSIEEPAKT